MLYYDENGGKLTQSFMNSVLCREKKPLALPSVWKCIWPLIKAFFYIHIPTYDYNDIFSRLKITVDPNN